MRSSTASQLIVVRPKPFSVYEARVSGVDDDRFHGQYRCELQELVFECRVRQDVLDDSLDGKAKCARIVCSTLSICWKSHPVSPSIPGGDARRLEMSGHGGPAVMIMT